MAQVFTEIAQLASVPGPVVLAIGVFDGLHLGHQAVIARAMEGAARANGSAVVVTFDPHPIQVLRPEKRPRLLTSAVHKRRLMAAAGIKYLLVLEFTQALAELPPEDFIRELHGACQPLTEVCVGHEWCFGKNRSGNLELLRRLGNELGFEEVGVPAVRLEQEVVSSTLIRAAVAAGNLERAAALLGRPYTLLGTVVKGNQIGHGLGFPTANLETENEQFPPNGVYAVEAMHGGALRKGVVNIGVRPTISGGGERLLELHLFDFDDQIYGDQIEIFFHGYLRAERKFENLEALKQQIQADVLNARQLLASKDNP